MGIDGERGRHDRQSDGLRGNVTKDRLDEGTVWHLHEDQQLPEGLANELGANRCFKIINNKYLTKNGL